MSHNVAPIEISIPPYFLCPISLELMRDPVTLSSGQTFDRRSIEKWLDDGNTSCPVTRQPLRVEDELIPNHILRRMIQGWCMTNRSKGVERIATPRQPVSLQQIRQLLDEIRLGDLQIGTLKKVNGLAKEHVRSRKQLLQSGVLPVLASYLPSSLRRSFDLPPSPRRSPSNDRLSPSRSDVAEEILSILSFLCESESASNFWCPTLEQLSSIARFLIKGTLDAKINAAVLLNSLQLSRGTMKVIGGLEGLVESVLQLIKDTMYPKASLVGLKLLLDLCSSSSNRTRATEAGAVDALVELLPGAEKKSAEAALALLAALCHSAEGRAAFTSHALSIPVTIKMLNSVSPTATEAALQTLLAVLNCPVCTISVKKDAAQAGAVLQLVMVIQQDSSSSTKGIAMKILKALKEVIDSEDCKIDLRLWSY